MKLHFYFSLLLSLLFSAQLFGQAQHENSSFDNWSTITTGLVEPDGFITTNVVPFTGATLPMGPFVEETSDAVDGNSAMKMNALTDTSGIFCISGLYQLPNVFSAPKPYTDRPEFIQGSHKGTMASAQDTANIAVTFTNNGTTVGAALVQFSGTSATYDNFEVPVVWTDMTTLPDSVFVAITLNGPNGPDNIFATIGSEYYLDGLNFALTSSILSPVMPEVSVNIYPNPSTEYVNFEMAQEDALDMISLDIHDVNGRLVRSIPVDGSITRLDVTSFTEGFYYYQLRGKEGFVANGGKFSVVK